MRGRARDRKGLTASVLTVVLAAGAAYADSDSLAWRTKSPAPVAVRRTAGSCAGTYFYLIGGFDGSAAIDAVFRYDNLLGNWEARSPMPFPTANHCAVYFEPENRIYVFGGEMQIAYEYVQVYDVGRDSWFYRFMPHADYGMSAAVLDDSIFVAFGGERPGLFYRYYPRTDNWSMRASFPDSAHSGAMCRLGAKIYYGGGWDSLRVFRSFDPQNNRWAFLPELPQGRHGLGLIPLAGEVYMVGGGQRWNTNGDARAVYVFNADSGRWRYDSQTAFNHIAGAYGTYTTLCDAYVFAVGGHNARACEVGHKLVSGLRSERILALDAGAITAVPNPYRNRTSFRLAGAATDHQSPDPLLIYSAGGVHVRTLCAAGSAEVAWDGRDDVGRSLPAGAYFVTWSAERLVVCKLN